MLGKRRVGWALRLLLVDGAALIVAFLLAYHIRVLLNQPLHRPAGPLTYYLGVLGLVLPVWLVPFGLLGGYGLRWLDRSRAWLALRASGAGLLLLAAGFFFSQAVGVNRSLLVLFAGLSVVSLGLAREAVVRWLRRRARDGRWRRNALVVGTDARAARLIAALRGYPEAGWWVWGCVSMDPGEGGDTVGGVPVVGPLSELPGLLQEGPVVDEVFFVPPPERLHELTEALEACEQLGVGVRVMVDLHRPVQAEAFVEELFGLPFYGFSPTLSRHGALALKRAVDVTGALSGLVVGLPLLVAIGLVIKATSRGPVLFRQERVGLHGRRFRMYKFRTMTDGAEAMQDRLAHLNELSGPVFKIPEDPRVTRAGRLLRRSSLDELPQLWNVLRGEMSLVGPRPLPVYEARLIKGAQRRRLAMRPGITGLWQVSGRSMVDFEEWMRLDLEYVDSWSPLLDLSILVRTVPTVLRGEGAA